MFGAWLPGLFFRESMLPICEGFTVPKHFEAHLSAYGGGKKTSPNEIWGGDKKRHVLPLVRKIQDMLRSFQSLIL